MFLVHTNPVLALDFSNNKLMLASADQAGTVRVWKIENGKCLRTVEIKKPVTDLKFIENDSKLVTISVDLHLRLIGLKSGSIIGNYKTMHEGYI